MRAFLYKERILLSRGGIIPEELSVHKYSLPICGDIVRRLKTANPGMEIGPLLRERLDRIRVKQEDLRRIISQKDTGGDPRLYPYQRIGVEWLLRIKRGILTDEQGLGKTVMAASACRQLGNDPLNIGIICSSTNISNWLLHMQRFFGDGISWANKTTGVAGVNHINGSETMISNYDNIASIKDHLDVLIVDEAHKIRNRKTKMFRAVRDLAKRSKYLFLLTASPTVNADYDMWALLHLCDPDRFSSYWSYIFRFFSVSDNGYGIKIEEVKKSEKENLLRMISPYVLRRDESEINLPKMSRREIIYTLGSDHRSIYQKMEDEWVASLDGKIVTADVKVAQITRLRQLVISPKILFPEYNGSSKIDTVAGIVHRSKDTIVIFTSFAEAAQLVKDKLQSEGITCEVMTGKVSRKKRDKMVENLGVTFRVMVLTHGTGGEGLNLVKATKAIFLDLAWHPAGNVHAQKRIHRIGQNNDVEIIVVRAKDTIEDHIFDIIRKKGRMAANDLINMYRRKR